MRINKKWLIGVLATCTLATTQITTANAATTTTVSTQKTVKQSKLAKNSYIIVSYKPKSHIHIYTKNGNSFKRNGKLLKNGATLKAYDKAKKGSSTYYYVGKKRWVNSKNVIQYHLKHTRYNVLKKNAKSRQYYTSQYFPVFAPWGCASSSLSMLMKYDGTWHKVPGSTDQAKLTYMQNHLPRNKSNGGQDGNPYNGLGFTRVILSYRLMSYAHQLGDKKVKDVSGISMNNLAKLVLSGHPVLYYGYSSYNGTGYRNHAKVIFGYSKKSNKFLVHDPLYQANKFYKGGGGHNRYDLGPISWVKASSIKGEFAYKGGNNALTTTK